ncbi:MAG TPA: HAMP domain-containing protein, partial [Pirellulales bacterium]|nr:HAMP domain-containing protein [Pirellulales bacterium]
MLFKWPIRTKLFACLGLLLVVVGLLSWGGISGLYAYRGLVRSLGRRVPELPLANQFSHDISELRIALNESRTSRELELTGHEISPLATRLARQEFRIRVQTARDTLEKYRRQLLDNPANSQIGDSRQEWMTVQAIQESLARVDHANLDEDWLLDEIHVGKLTNELEYLQQLAAELPSYLYKKINDFTEEARGQYRSLITLTVATTVAAIVMFIAFMERFYQWVFRPLRILVRGSRKVAGGQFHHRIHLDTHDEMSELAQAMNDMTERFQTIRDDLDRQVQERSREVIRSEQLASVGFLAAGV